MLVGTTRDEATFLFRTGGRDAPDEQVERVTAHLFREPTERWARARAAAGGARAPVPHRPRLARSAARRAAHDRRPAAVRHLRDSEVARHYVADDERTREVSAWMQREWGRFLHGEDLGWRQFRQMCMQF